MAYRLLNGSEVNFPINNVVDGVGYKPEDFTDPVRRQEKGIKLINIQAFDSEHYQSTASNEEIDSNGDIVRTFTLEPKFSLGELKANRIATVKGQARSLISQTDWYIIREMDDPERPAPEVIKESRAAIRVACDEMEATINAQTDYQELIDLSTTLNG